MNLNEAKAFIKRLEKVNKIHPEFFEKQEEARQLQLTEDEPIGFWHEQNVPTAMKTQVQQIKKEKEKKKTDQKDEDGFAIPTVGKRSEAQITEGTVPTQSSQKVFKEPK